MSHPKRHLSLRPQPAAAASATAPAPDPDLPPEDASASVEEAFRRYAPLVASLGMRIMAADPAEIDDLVQEVFLRATRGMSGVRHQGAIKSWLVKITINVARARLRLRKLRRLVGLDQPADYAELADPSLSAEQRVQVARVYEALDRLPVNERLAWQLRHVEGKSLAAVASLCHCSLATAKRRIAAAQKALQAVVS